MKEIIKVLLPSDGSETSLKAAAYASRLTKLNPQKKVTVLVVIPDANKFLGGELPEKLDALLEEKAREALERTAEIFKNEGITVKKVIEKGDPAQVILSYAGQGSYNHIIMGSRGVSELRGSVLGSVSHKVINLAQCRVTLVK